MRPSVVRTLLLAGLSICLAWPALGKSAHKRPEGHRSSRWQGSGERAELRVRLQQAERKLRQGDGVGALLDVEAVLSRDDRLWEAYWLRGRIQAQLGDDLGARDSLVRAAALDPGNAPLHFAAASLALRLADVDSAWQQLLAAAQSGYDRAQIEALSRQLEDIGHDTDGLAAALEAPRVVVRLHDGVSPQMDDLAIELRNLLLEEQAVGLVKDPSMAALEVDLASVTDTSGEAADATATDEIQVRVRDRTADRLLIERRLPAAGAPARAALSDLVAELVETLGRKADREAPAARGRLAQKSKATRAWTLEAASPRTPDRSARS